MEHHTHKHVHSHLGLSPFLSMKRAFTITAICLVLEIVGGFISNSLTLLSDSAHLFTDCGALLIGMMAMRLAHPDGKECGPCKGSHPSELWGALINGLLIFVLAIGIIFEAISRLNTPPVIHGQLMLIIAVLGLFGNLYSMKLLHHHQESNLNVQGAYLHVLFDAVGSVVAIVSSLLVLFWGMNVVDAWASLLLSALMLFSSSKLIFKAISGLRCLKNSNL